MASGQASLKNQVSACYWTTVSVVGIAKSAKMATAVLVRALVVGKPVDVSPVDSPYIFSVCTNNNKCC